MDKKLYDMMDWAGVEAIIYSEEDHPEQYLGPHQVEDGITIQAFFPDAREVTVKAGAVGKEKKYLMDMEDETGYFAVLIPGKRIPAYTFLVKYEDDSVVEYKDPYSFAPQITEKDTKKFNAGICYDIYNKLGAHPMTINGTDGVYFAVWAPNAMRVSVVGDFNMWDGRRLPMRRLADSGIFELFVPELSEGEIYKYEIKAKGGLTYLKADPYANAAELRPNTASVVTDLRGFEWTDEKWMEQRKSDSTKDKPMFVYELHMGSFRKPDDGRIFYNYRELAPMIADYVKEMGYTHVELLPIMEHPFDGSWGYQVTGYYAPTARYGTPQDFMYFMNYMHEQGIGVILDWVPAHFPRDTHGLSGFDGTCLYEHLDPRQGAHPHWGTLIYNYGRPEVSNFLIANALFWKNVYHADGIRMDAVASMLYLDYGKNDGEWVANMYGGNENLEAVEFLKHLNSIFKKDKDGAILIAEESSAWPKITTPVEEDGLGFDYKWNMGWMNDFLGYMQLDPFFRSYHHGELTFSMIYAYSEDFVLTLSHDEVVHGKGSMIGKMPGKRKAKFANLRAAYGYMMMHPGKKLLFMGQDIAQFDEWNEESQVEWELLQYDEHRQMQDYLKALVKLYKEQPALFAKDYDPAGFEWINNISADENMLVFMRRTEKEEDDLLIVVNFSPLVYEKHKIGVPYCGKFKEIFNSDSTQFGGEGNTNPRVKPSKKSPCDEREDSIEVLVPPMGISVFKCTRIEETPKKEKETQTAAKKTARKTAQKKSTAKTSGKTEAKKTAQKSDDAKQVPAKRESGAVVAVEKKKGEVVAVEKKKGEVVPVEKKKGEVVAVEKKKGEVVAVEKKKGEAVPVEKAFVQEEKPVQRKKTAGRKAAGKAVKKADAHEVE
ncbi:MAG: 1,4-alpha-glucan branching protein GlgB [Lachnospiraceae bacterium]|nr:1,4-alpha-glucan branching protein GlgB [Lachnospiraceae bacterium]